MSAAEMERAAHAATVALSEFDRAGVTTVLQTVPALAQTLRELLAAVTAPAASADDVVHEARPTAYAAYGGKTGILRYVERDEEIVEDLRRGGYEIRPLFEIRPRGTVTDAEGAWQYGVRHVTVDGWPMDRVHVSLEDARADLDTCGMNCHLVRRRSAWEAGRWEPVDVTGEDRS